MTDLCMGCHLIVQRQPRKACETKSQWDAGRGTPSLDPIGGHEVSLLGLPIVRAVSCSHNHNDGALYD